MSIFLTFKVNVYMALSLIRPNLSNNFLNS
jgi:hypothetical protein